VVVALIRLSCGTIVGPALNRMTVAVFTLLINWMVVFFIKSVTANSTLKANTGKW
jgi:hypothetical protein